MTSMQIMTNRRRRAVLAAALLAALGGCARPQRPVINPRLISPYDEPVTWAVAPLANESGVSVVDGVNVADLIAREVQKIDGIDAVPVQRVLEGMRAMDIGSIDSPHTARSLARLIGVDGIIVGSITAWDPYNPPILGLTLQLYAAAPAPIADGAIENISRAASDTMLQGFGPADWPSSSVAIVADASDNGVRLDVERFARGRTETNSALNWQRYLVVMDLYTQYVVERLLRELLREERWRADGRLAKASQRPAS